MTRNKSVVAVIYALLAAVFYAINTPFSKISLPAVPTTFMAAFLYMGAGFGVYNWDDSFNYSLKYYSFV